MREQDERMHRPGDGPCPDDRHIWQVAHREWRLVGTSFDVTVREGEAAGFTNEDRRHRKWTLYVCFLCGSRKGITEAIA